jgi:RNA polymerase sigma-70 factor (ECF subfamily)
MGIGEAELFEQAQRGDPAALERLVLEHQGWVRRLTARLAPMSADPDDLAQEVFIVVLRRLDRFDPRSGGFRAWVCAIARNIALRAWESARVRQSHWPSLVERALQSASVAAAPPSIVEQDLRSLRECVAGLAPASRELVTLRYRDRMTCEEMGRRLDRNPPALRMALTRIRTVLRACLEGKGVRSVDISGIRP